MLYVLPEPPMGGTSPRSGTHQSSPAGRRPRRITVPVLGAVYRSVLGQGDFGVYLVGPTGARKTSPSGIDTTNLVEL